MKEVLPAWQHREEAPSKGQESQPGAFWCLTLEAKDSISLAPRKPELSWKEFFDTEIKVFLWILKDFP